MITVKRGGMNILLILIKKGKKGLTSKRSTSVWDPTPKLQVYEALSCEALRY